MHIETSRNYNFDKVDIFSCEGRVRFFLSRLRPTLSIKYSGGVSGMKSLDTSSTTPVWATFKGFSPPTFSAHCTIIVANGVTSGVWCLNLAKVFWMRIVWQQSDQTRGK